MKIIERDIPPRAAWALEQAGVHPLLARLFAARGVSQRDELDDGLARLLPTATAPLPVRSPYGACVRWAPRSITSSRTASNTVTA